ncbi:hypothetical protein SD427_11020 [Chryseobacterium sp. JJR-5R]|uniref:hypothetical protein n=1 Tax=Chryseobacterium sp. JJR-5R TaxID=3093923 RepID=UPI002A7637B4|nr:hypothetical protein [Chryseobacterium sp. JJR-5R]WPO81294.1 hypothetical protein SD427_11020 [Chryseobacterium sp. JJR-5R]
MKLSEYKYLIGKSKQQVMLEMGNQMNHYPFDVWIYELKTNWLGQKVSLLISFENETVCDVSITRSWR